MIEGSLNEEPGYLSFSNLIILHKLGRGSTSHVFKTQSIRSKKFYAMKVIDKSKLDYDKQGLQNQISILRILNHKNIAQFYKHFQDQDNHYILTQYCNNGEITKLLMNSVNQKILLKIIHEIGNALNYLHNFVSVAHGDIKLSNILMSDSNLKLCDFGFSVQINQLNGIDVPKKGLNGTLMYMSPQMLLNKNFQQYKQADVWALGICILTLMVRGNPYKIQSSQLLRQKIINGQFINVNKINFPNYSQDFLQIISKMLAIDVKKRPSIKQIINNRIFKKGKKNVNQSIQKRQINQKNIKQQTIQNQQKNLNKLYQSQLKIQANCQTNATQSQCLNHQIQKQENNKSISNTTTDTFTDSQQNQLTLSKQNFWAYCLKPQKHKTQNQGFVEVLSDRSVKIKIQKLQYKISADGKSLQIISGAKNLKKYSKQQIWENQKIHKLYNHAAQMIAILKKKQCNAQKFIKGQYCWTTKTSISCLIGNKIIIQKCRSKNRILIQNLEDALEYELDLYTFYRDFKEQTNILQILQKQAEQSYKQY